MDSRYDNLLDEETHPVWGKYVRSNEKIFWEGNPQVDMSIRLLEIGPYHDVMTGASSNFIIYLMVLFVIARAIYGEDGLVAALPFILTGIGLIFVFELLRNKSNKRIRYAVTSNYLLIRFDYLVLKKIAAIPLSKVISISPINYQDNTTSLLFPNHNETRIKTIDFVTGKRRDHTSFERIADGEEVLQLITDLIKDNKLAPLQYHYPMMRESVVRFSRKVYQLLLFISVLYVVDFYVLPKRTTTDFVIETVWKTPLGFNTGATHYTQKGFRFSTDNVYSFYGDESEVVFDYSPVFKSVTALKTYRMDYTDRLDNDLNLLGKYAALICFITFLSGIVILNKTPLSQEAYMQLIVCTVFFLILFWVVNNWLQKLSEMNYQIESIEKSAYQEVVDVWELSVRATHHFLKEEDIAYFKPLILNTYLDAVELRCVKNKDGEIIGFSGVAENNLEMLFIHPDERGNGIGKLLLTYAINEQEVTKVDVNEDNKQALGFYEKFGFKTYSRSALDGTGKPYPILHMQLNNDEIRN